MDAFELLMLYYFFAMDVESSQLPTINSFLKGDFDKNVQWLQDVKRVGGMGVPEVLVCRVAREKREGALDWSSMADTLRSEWNTLGHDHARVDAENLPFMWAMQLMGLPPISALFSRYRHVCLQHDSVDHVFAHKVRLWYLVWLICPPLLHGYGNTWTSRLNCCD